MLNFCRSFHYLVILFALVGSLPVDYAFSQYANSYKESALLSRAELRNCDVRIHEWVGYTPHDNSVDLGKMAERTTYMRVILDYENKKGSFISQGSLSMARDSEPTIHHRFAFYKDGNGVAYPPSKYGTEPKPSEYFKFLATSMFPRPELFGIMDGSYPDTPASDFAVKVVEFFRRLNRPVVVFQLPDGTARIVEGDPKGTHIISWYEPKYTLPTKVDQINSLAKPEPFYTRRTDLKLVGGYTIPTRMEETHERIVSFGSTNQLKDVMVTEIKVTRYEWLSLNSDVYDWPDHRDFMKTAESRAEFLGILKD